MSIGLSSVLAGTLTILLVEIAYRAIRDALNPARGKDAQP